MPRLFDSNDNYTGKAQAKYVWTAEDLMEASDKFPYDCLRVQMETTGGDPLTLTVPLHASAAKKLEPFVPAGLEVPTGHQPLRDFIEEHFTREQVWVNAWNGWVMCRLAPPGRHIFTLHTLQKRTNAKGQERIWFTVRTDDGMEATWSAPYHAKAEVGKSPESDGLGLNPDSTMYTYLDALGFDPEKFAEELMAAPALWPDHGIESFFSNKGDICPELLQAIARHGARQVEIPIGIHETYGLGPKRKNDRWKTVDITKVVVAGDNKKVGQEFLVEKQVFETMYDSLTKIMCGEEAAFLDEQKVPVKPYDETTVVQIMVPVVREYPWIVAARKKDGSPELNFPVTAADWTLDGLIALNKLAEALVKADAEGDIELSNPMGLVDREDPSKLLTWIEGNVPELAGYKEEVEVQTY